MASRKRKWRNFEKWTLLKTSTATDYYYSLSNRNELSHWFVALKSGVSHRPPPGEIDADSNSINCSNLIWIDDPIYPSIYRPMLVPFNEINDTDGQQEKKKNRRKLSEEIGEFIAGSTVTFFISLIAALIRMDLPRWFRRLWQRKWDYFEFTEVARLKVAGLFFFVYVSSVASPASPASPAAAIVAISPALRRCRLDGALAPARNERPPAGWKWFDEGL